MHHLHYLIFQGVSEVKSYSVAIRWHRRCNNNKWSESGGRYWIITQVVKLVGRNDSMRYELEHWYVIIAVIGGHSHRKHFESGPSILILGKKFL